MKILLLGSGGREHALAWKLSLSGECSQLFFAPGNAGTQNYGINLPISVSDFKGITEACVNHQIDMVVVGPEEPLVSGIVDHLQRRPELAQLLVIGPNKEAAQLEGSKAYAKSFMERHGIPTARYREFTADRYEEGIKYIKESPLPIVLKADGLAAGKGVVICHSQVEAVAEFELMILRSKFGEAGKRVVVEEFLEGIELSMFALTDGRNYKLLPSAKDYKQIGEGNKGLNTGGMGAISPVPFATNEFIEKVRSSIVEPTIAGLRKENLEYRGFIFFGLIKCGGDPFVIEYNCRLGDPETEVILPRTQADLVNLLKDAATGRLQSGDVQTEKGFAATVVAVSGGYPNDYQKGYEITGLEKLKLGEKVFLMGTKEKQEKLITNGGRVLCVTQLGESLGEALQKCYESLEQIHFEEMYFRKDIGFEFLPLYKEG